eukprot:CAMPEP_0175858364 /NCGR_PEP_ID=MMETSP0107_2-20121207/29622_1 /TAXON_ID=195067 ORGANISM="Goniomonas pacifica, Strain CCMP1869" /NCGR_SAMPLE_ID=MMETSP0107_2 /ASSEMBLY_ACC=CAM_ASM_000203 /LENGTH=108 /DNA_ID=CAMNT_0017174791 /DNA_START=60 /DNA_END=382 /DNA_ORIENTATION=+
MYWRKSGVLEASLFLELLVDGGDVPVNGTEGNHRRNQICDICCELSENLLRHVVEERQNVRLLEGRHGGLSHADNELLPRNLCSTHRGPVCSESTSRLKEAETRRHAG